MRRAASDATERARVPTAARCGAVRYVACRACAWFVCVGRGDARVTIVGMTRIVTIRCVTMGAVTFRVCLSGV